jgi:hypothetical protein
VAASRWLRDKKARQEAEQHVEIKANAITARPLERRRLPSRLWQSIDNLAMVGAHLDKQPPVTMVSIMGAYRNHVSQFRCHRVRACVWPEMRLIN